MGEELQQAIAAINAEVAKGNLQLNRDIYSNISLPTYRDVTFPTSVGANTGFLPGDYAGGYGGMPTFGALSGVTGMMGRVGGGPGGEIDPRLAALGYSANDLTLGGQQQRLAEDAQRARERQFDRTFDLQQAGQDQARFNDYTAQANKDRQYALEINADPNSIVAGQIVPDWLKPHAEWARQYASQNGGQLPTAAVLRTTLAGYGASPEDYLPGGSRYGANSNATVQPLGQGAPVAGAPNTTPFGTPAGTPPGLPQPATPQAVTSAQVTGLNAAYQKLITQLGVPYLSATDPRLIGLYQNQLGVDLPTAQRYATAASDWSRQHPGQTLDPTTQAGLYTTPAPPAAQTQQVQGAQQATPGATQQALQAGGPTMSGIGAAAAQYAAQAPPGSGGGLEQMGTIVDDGGAPAGPTGQPGAYTPAGQGGQQQEGEMMRYQDQMMRQPRQYGGPAMRYGGGGGQSPFGVNYGGSGQTGQFGYGQAMSAEQRRLLEQGRSTDIQAQLGQNQQRIAEQGQRQDVALRALQQESQLRADPFQLAQYRYGLGQTGIPGVIGAVAGSGVLPGVQGPQGMAPQRPTMQNQIGQATGGTGTPGGMPTFGRQPGMADTNAQLAALPAMNQINARNYTRLGAGGQQYVNSAYRASGMAGSDQDIQEAVQQGLPQFARRRSVPTFGRVA